MKFVCGDAAVGAARRGVRQAECLGVARFRVAAGAGRQGLDNGMFDRIFYRVFRFAFLLGGTVAVIVSIYNIIQERQFQKEGVETQGAIIDKSHTSINKHSYYSISYTFAKPTTGETITGKDLVEPGVWKGLKVGDAISVQYVRSDSSNHRLRRVPDWARVVIGLVAGAILFGLSFVVKRIQGAPDRHGT